MRSVQSIATVEEVTLTELTPALFHDPTVSPTPSGSPVPVAGGPGSTPG